MLLRQMDLEGCYVNFSWGAVTDLSVGTTEQYVCYIVWSMYTVRRYNRCAVCSWHHDATSDECVQVMLARACVTLAPAFAGQYYNTCAVGFSAVLFAMKVVLNSKSPGWTSMYGISLPTKVSCHLHLPITCLSPAYHLPITLPTWAS